jgi:hypothetical protein
MSSGIPLSCQQKKSWVGFGGFVCLGEARTQTFLQERLACGPVPRRKKAACFWRAAIVAFW